MASNRQYNNAGYQRALRELRRDAKAHGAVCHLCGDAIDPWLPGSHPMGLTGDHIEALADGGAVDGPLAPAHLVCNSGRGGATGWAKRQERRRNRMGPRVDDVHPGLV